MNYELAKNEIHIWIADLYQPYDIYKKLLTSLSDDELQRAQRFRFYRDRRRFITGRAILRKIIGNYLKVESHQLNFVYSKFGMPSLKKENKIGRLCFNLSHSEEIVLFIFSQEQTVGIDTEKIRYLPGLCQIAKEFMSDGEYKMICSLNRKDQNNLFYSFWVRREALLKAMGYGLAYLPELICAALTERNNIMKINHTKFFKKDASWAIHDFVPQKGYIASFAVEGIIDRIKFLKWNSRKE